MNISLTIDPPYRLVATLREGPVETVAEAANGPAAGRVLLEALEQARDTGYGECFWHEMTGQYWWMFRREAETVEVVVLWSSGAVTGWRHVFRATDAIAFVIDRVREELAASTERP